MGGGLGCAIEVHRTLGPGLLILELKAVDRTLAIHQVQLLTYMKLAEAPIGLIINFNVLLLKDGINKCAISNFSAHSASSCVNSKLNQQ